MNIDIYVSVYTFGKVEGKGGLIGTEIVNMENEFLWQVLLASPDNPTNTSIDQTILMATHINTLH